VCVGGHIYSCLLKCIFTQIILLQMGNWHVSVSMKRKLLTKMVPNNTLTHINIKRAFALAVLMPSLKLTRFM